MLVEEFCGFVEDVDLVVKLGLQSKLVNLIERPDLQKIGSNRGGSDDGMLEVLGGSSLSGVLPISEMPKPPAVRYTFQYAFGQKPGRRSMSQNSSTYPAEPLHLQEVSRESPHSCKACEKLGYYRGPPAFVCALPYVKFRMGTDCLLILIASSGVLAPAKTAPYTRGPRKSASR